MIIPNIWENKKCSKPPTSYHLPVELGKPMGEASSNKPTNGKSTSMTSQKPWTSLRHPKTLRSAVLDCQLFLQATCVCEVLPQIKCFKYFLLSDLHCEKLICHRFWHLIYMAYMFWHSSMAFYPALFSDILYHSFWYHFWHSISGKLIIWHSILAFYLVSFLTFYSAILSGIHSGILEAF